MVRLLSILDENIFFETISQDGQVDKEPGEC